MPALAMAGGILFVVAYLICAELLAQTPGTILQALSPTWTLNGRLLRPAMVVVAKPPTDDLAQPR